jgi:Kef-type K+ transport system membrane component KefB
MVSRGEVGLIVAAVGVSQGFVSPNLFSVVVVVILLTTIITPVLLRRVFQRVPELVPARAVEG